MVKILTDSTADLDYLFEREQIESIPLTVTLDGKSYLDGVTIVPQMIYDAYESKKLLPKTSAVSIADYTDFFKKATARGDEAVHISISSELSLTYDNAEKAAEGLHGVYVVDARSLSTGIGLLVLKAKDMAREGCSAREIYEKITALVPHVQASFVVSTMDFLYKGGRCSGLANFIAKAFQIKPQLSLKDGKIIVAQKYLGSFEKNIIKYVDNILERYNNPDYSRIFITHTQAHPEIVQRVEQRIREKAPAFKQILKTNAGCTITAHCGKGTLGILYINKP